MKKQLTLITIILIAFSSYSQSIKTDIFDNLEYKSSNYRAYFKKNIFDDLIFTDSNDNKLTMKNKYLAIKHSSILKDKNEKIDLFSELIAIYKNRKRHNISYTVEFDNKIVINENGKKTIIHKEISDKLTYKRGNKKATLHKDIHNKWIYKDSNNNELKISVITWNRLIERFRSEDDVFNHLVYEFLEI